MRKYIFIGLGGILGAILRYYIKNIQLYHYNGAFPLNTFIINITGSFLLAFILTAALLIKGFDSDIKLGIGTGFIGAYTTFSTMCKETALLITSGYFVSAACYILLSIILGLGAAYLGTAVARIVSYKQVDTKWHQWVTAEETAADLEEEAE
ncbi:fluoride efflux transporter CrcB [Candidatus Clostridium radicumherbarum]|uniref:Fluoride-specific ion channel FluC n=1 Tax=Candidatus Clostridium radicumherbarum TaxID=3381662 RepID=A0ABW8TLY5_9CLOT